MILCCYPFITVWQVCLGHKTVYEHLRLMTWLWPNSYHHHTTKSYKTTRQRIKSGTFRYPFYVFVFTIILPLIVNAYPIKWASYCSLCASWILFFGLFMQIKLEIEWIYEVGNMNSLKELFFQVMSSACQFFPPPANTDILLYYVPKSHFRRVPFIISYKLSTFARPFVTDGDPVHFVCWRYVLCTFSTT